MPGSTPAAVPGFAALGRRPRADRHQHPERPVEIGMALEHAAQPPAHDPEDDVVDGTAEPALDRLDLAEVEAHPLDAAMRSDGTIERAVGHPFESGSQETEETAEPRPDLPAAAGDDGRQALQPRA
jgi:hypothetical protein